MEKEMKKLTVVILLVCMLFAGCTSSTEFGQCIGAFDEKLPGLHYKISAWNVGVALLTFGLIVPPVFVLVDQTWCPVGKK